MKIDKIKPKFMNVPPKKDERLSEFAIQRSQHESKRDFPPNLSKSKSKGIIKVMLYMNLLVTSSVMFDNQNQHFTKILPNIYIFKIALGVLLILKDILNLY